MTLHAPTGPVPGIDSPDNIDSGDVIGNKNDTVAGTSLVSLVRVAIADIATAIADIATVDGYHDVPAANSADNAQMRDVVGNKTDRTYGGAGGDSVYAHVQTMAEHIHSVGWVLPDGGNAVTVTPGAGAWAAYGAESATLGTPAGPFDVHHLVVVASANDEYQLRLSVDGTPVFEGCFERVGVQTSSFDIPVQMPITAAASITAAVRTRAAGVNTITVKVMGHDY